MGRDVFAPGPITVEVFTGSSWFNGILASWGIHFIPISHLVHPGWQLVTGCKKKAA